MFVLLDFSKSCNNIHPVFGVICTVPSIIIYLQMGLDTPNNFYRTHSKKKYIDFFPIHSFRSVCRCCLERRKKIELYCLCVVARVKRIYVCTSEPYECFIRYIVLCPIPNESCTMQTSYYYISRLLSMS